MPEMRELMDGVAGDLAAVRWPPAEELRRRVRRRRQRTTAAAVAVLVALAGGAASLARPDRDPPPPPAATPTPGAAPVEIPLSALLRPEDAGAGPDSQVDGEDALQPIRLDVTLDRCLREKAPELLSVRTRYARLQTLLKGTETDRPAQPYVLAQGAYRLTTAEATTFLRRLRGAIEACDGFTSTGEIEHGGGRVDARGTYHWSVISSGFAGDESYLVRMDGITRRADNGDVIGESTYLSAYVRVGDLVTVLSPRSGASVDELRRLATVAAGRLCVASVPGC
jgi:hypothetical protein